MSALDSINSETNQRMQKAIDSLKKSSVGSGWQGYPRFWMVSQLNITVLMYRLTR